MSDTGIKLCEQAFYRLKMGIPQNSSFKGKKITAALVSKEAGFDSGYLKNSRTQHRPLIHEINKFYQDTKNKYITSSRIEKLNKKIKELEEDIDELKKQRDASLARELLLFNEIERLQNLLKEENANYPKGTPNANITLL